MPARKSNASAADDAAAKAPVDGISIEDLNLPKSIVQRLSKGVLPPNTQIQKDALLAMSKSATVFVNYLTNSASEHALRGGKKTVQPGDVLEAMKELEFDSFLPRLEAEVSKYNSIQCEKRNSYRKKVRDEKKAKESTDTSSKAIVVNGHTDDAPPSKRARRSSVDNGVHVSGSDEEVDVDETVEEDQPDEEEAGDDEEVEEAQEEGLTEDPLEVKESEASDDEMADGDESD